MSEQDNIKIVRQIFDYLNKHDVPGTEQYLTSSVQYEAPGVPGLMKRDQGRLYTQGFIEAFPDLHFDLKDVIAQGNKVATTWVASGTNKGTMTTPDGTVTLPPTNKKASVPGVTVFDFQNDKIIHQAIYWDQVMLLKQLGVNVDQLLASRR